MGSSAFYHHRYLFHTTNEWREQCAVCYRCAHCDHLYRISRNVRSEDTFTTALNNLSSWLLWLLFDVQFIVASVCVSDCMLHCCWLCWSCSRVPQRHHSISQQPVGIRHLIYEHQIICFSIFCATLFCSCCCVFFVMPSMMKICTHITWYYVSVTSQ